MSNPSFDNIDKWLFEYTEGNLSASQEAQLKLFLLQNPSLEQDLETWQLAKVDASSVVFPNLDQHIRKPFAWMIPSATALGVLLASGLGWMVMNSHDESIVAADGVHTFSAQYFEKGNSKVEDFYGAKKGNKAIDFSSISFNPPTFGNDFMNYGPFCGGIIDVSTMYPQFSFVQDGAMTSNSSQEIGNKKGSKEDLSLTSSSEKEVKLEDAQANIQVAKAMSRTERNSSATRNGSFSSKAKSFLRKVIRMTDNPIALTNSKDIYYHVPGMQNLDVSFGTAGSLLRTRAQAISRMQWTGHSQQQFSNQISIDSYVKSIRGGIGLQLNHAYYGNGEYQVGQFAIVYSPKFAVSKNVVIEPAIRFKMGDKRLDNQKTIPGQMVELERGSTRIVENEAGNVGNQHLWYKDVGIGLVSNTKWFSAGIQIDNLGRHYTNAYNSGDDQNRAENHITATLGTDYVSRTKIFSYSPYLMYQKMENLSEIWGGSNFRYKKITFGGAISSNLDYAGSVGFKTNRLMMTYNADYSFSVLSNKRLFSQQLTVRILTNKGRNDQRMLNL